MNPSLTSAPKIAAASPACLPLPHPSTQRSSVHHSILQFHHGLSGKAAHRPRWGTSVTGGLNSTGHEDRDRTRLQHGQCWFIYPPSAVGNRTALARLARKSCHRATCASTRCFAQVAPLRRQQSLNRVHKRQTVSRGSDTARCASVSVAVDCPKHALVSV